MRADLLQQQNMRSVDRTGRQPIDLIVGAQRRLDGYLDTPLCRGRVRVQATASGGLTGRDVSTASRWPPPAVDNQAQFESDGGCTSGFLKKNTSSPPPEFLFFFLRSM